MSNVNVLFVDDEPRVLQAMNFLFRRLYNVFVAESAEKALLVLEQKKIDVIVSDQKMPGMNGTSLLHQCARISPRTIRVLLTGYSDIEDAINAVNSGEIYRYIRKPWDNNDIREIVASAVEAALAIRDNPEPEELTQMGGVEENAGVLVVDDGNLFDHIADGLRAEYCSYRASDIYQALDMIEMHHIGVLVIESTPAKPANINFVKALKYFRPDINSIVLTKSADIDEVIDLINTGRVYRFGRLPAKSAMLRLSIDSGLRHHARLVVDPRLRKSQAIDRDTLVRQLKSQPLSSVKANQAGNERDASGWTGVLAKLKGLRKTGFGVSAGASA